jgi:hypothetical protein
MDVPELERVPAPGDFLASLRRNGELGSHYQVVTVREVRRRDPAAAPRFAMRCRRVPPPPPPPAGPVTWVLRWYDRGRKTDRF